MQRTIILIEDENSSGILIRALLAQKGFEVIWFKTFNSAFDFLNDLKISEISLPTAIIFDYILDKNDNTVTSIPLVEIVRDMGYTHPMIANSSEDLTNSFLVEAGCTHLRPGDDKTEVVEYVISLIT